MSGLVTSAAALKALIFKPGQSFGWVGIEHVGAGSCACSGSPQRNPDVKATSVVSRLTFSEKGGATKQRIS